MAKYRCIHTVVVPDQYEVSLWTKGRDNFMVVYGSHMRDRLTYTEAAHEFGECVFHALACAGSITSTTD